MPITVAPRVNSMLAWAHEYLRLHAVPNPEHDAAAILAYLLGCERIELHTERHTCNDYVMLEYYRLIALRATRYPLQYIIGSAGFMGFEFTVRPGVFIPRPETELLVETVLELVNSPQSTVHRKDHVRGPWTVDRGLRILDLCTGCGNIAISLTKLQKTVKIIASDSSDIAVEVAKENAARHGCGSIAVIKSKLFAALYVKEFDIIVSNPPYVPSMDLANVMPELAFEPREALDGGEDGLRYYRRIFNEAPSFLANDGHLIVEIGDNQREALHHMIDHRQYRLCNIVKDYNGSDRVMVIRRHDG